MVLNKHFRLQESKSLRQDLYVCDVNSNNVSWSILYLMVSGNKVQLVEQILKHADGSVARTFDEDIEDNDNENMTSSSHDDTLSDSEEESTEYEGGSSGDDYVERSFQVLFIDDADIPEVV